MELVLRALPCDLSFADEHDVRDCHPGHSMAVLEEVLAAFRSGAKDVAEGWRQDGERFKYARYSAVRDDSGVYRGILEVSHDITDLRALEGAQPLPGW